MPLGDWTRVSAGTFHAFHNAWITELQRALNGGVLPADFYALGEQWAGDIGPDVLTLHRGGPAPPGSNGGAPARAIAVADRPPRARITQQASDDVIHYLAKRRSLVIRHTSGDRVVAFIEVVSPGKQSRMFLQQLLDKVLAAIGQGCQLLVVDVLPPGTLDPNGLHDLIWQCVTAEAFELPAPNLRTLASYRSAAPPTAYVELIEVGEPIPPMALFLSSEEYVNVPLEETYQAAFATMPAHIRDLVGQTS